MKTLSKEERGALLLKSFPPPVVELVLARLAPQRGKRLRSLMQGLPDDKSEEELDEVLKEVEKLLTSQPAPAARPQAPAKKEAAVEAPPVEDPETIKDPLAALARLDSEKLALALQGENPRTVNALLLHFLAGEQAGEVFRRLPAEQRRDVSAQFSPSGPPSLELMQRIAQGILRKARLIKGPAKRPGPDDSYRKMADMIRLLDKPERKEVIAALEQRDATAAAAINSLLYNFDDLLRIEKRSMQKLLGELDLKNLAVALKNASADIVTKVTSNMSQRAQETLKEEMELSGIINAADIAQAQKAVVDTIQRLDQAGDLTMTEQ